jgi:uncharacterized protein (TIGR02996 family)
MNGYKLFTESYSAFLNQMINAHGDQTNRMVAADWIDESGDNLLAEFIRICHKTNRRSTSTNDEFWSIYSELRNSLLDQGVGIEIGRRVVYDPSERKENLLDLALNPRFQKGRDYYEIKAHSVVRLGSKGYRVVNVNSLPDPVIRGLIAILCYRVTLPSHGNGPSTNDAEGLLRDLRTITFEINNTYRQHNAMSQTTLKRLQQTINFILSLNDLTEQQRQSFAGSLRYLIDRQPQLINRGINQFLSDSYKKLTS